MCLLSRGSVIFTEAENHDLRELYWGGIGEVATKIGYGTITAEIPCIYCL